MREEQGRGREVREDQGRSGEDKEEENYFSGKGHVLSAKWS
jgi:hypothetical protein